jgi:hypothetical protein
MNRLATLFIVLLCAASVAHARNPIRSAFFSVYSSANGTVLDDVASNSNHCGVCHFDFDGGDARNLYGYAVEWAIKSGNFGSDEAAIQSVENLDSDNDGYTNLEEITTGYFGNAPTFPGLNDKVVGLTVGVTLTDIQGHLTPSAPVETTTPAVTVTSPNGGENFQAETTQLVTWSATDASGILYVNIDLSDDGGATFKPVAVREPNDGTFNWFVPNLPGNQSIIRVAAIDSAGNRGSDWGNGTFTITAVGGGTVPTTLRDMDLPGTQPLTGVVLEDPDETCVVCHGGYDSNLEPWYLWKGSMMAQAQRDPLFLATVAVAEQDAPSSGDLCLRCHTPGGWSEGRSVDTGGGLINAKDRQGVQCDFCHRTVDPVYQSGVSPPEDAAVLDSLTTLPLTAANGQFVMDADPMRRGPYNDASWVHASLTSPFHNESDMCATCHDVSNPVFVAGATPGDYVPNAFDAPHPDGDLRNMFPVERTYSEWSMSEYASTYLHLSLQGANRMASYRAVRTVT